MNKDFQKEFFCLLFCKETNSLIRRSIGVHFYCTDVDLQEIKTVL